MPVESRSLGRSVVTPVTFVRFLASVCSDVLCEVLLVARSVVTHSADVLVAVLAMDAEVRDQELFVVADVVTLCTLELHGARRRG